MVANYLKMVAKTCRDGEPFACAPARVFNTQVRALARKIRSTGLKSVVVGVSGGLDSALCLIVAAAAFDLLKLSRNAIRTYTMPGFGTSRRTRSNASALCRELGIPVETIDITAACRRHLKDIGHDGKTPDAVYENSQARMRTMVLLDKANMHEALVLGTGDLSEIALGWCTFGGDALSHFGVNAGVPKTVVRKVCAWWAAKHASKTMADIVATPVSPELVKGQTTEEKIGPYELHDFFLWKMLKEGAKASAALKAAIAAFKGKYAPQDVRKTFGIFRSRYNSQAFKREAMPPGIDVFGIGLAKKL